MGEFYDEIPDDHVDWIKKQEMFWVGTAPLSGEAHVNISPKGCRDSFHIVNAKQVWYEDMSGSGIETISHLRENGRITLMFSAFTGAPRIMRLFGKGTVHEYGTPEYDALVSKESRRPGLRAAIVIDIHKVGTSCGYAVPFYDFKSHRTRLFTMSQKFEEMDNAAQLKSGDPAAFDEGGLKGYWKGHNFSIDGLPALRTAQDSHVPFVHRVDLEELKRGNTEGQFFANSNLKRPGIVQRLESAVPVAHGAAVISFVVGIAIGLAFTTMRASLKNALPLAAA